jgi:hypothetical protein
MVTLGTKALEVRGPEAAKAQYLPQVAANAREIRKLLLAGGLQAAPRCQGRVPGVVCPACGWIHGTMTETPPCGGCGATDAVVTVVSMAGDRLCGRCFRG